MEQPLRRSHRIQGLFPEYPQDPTTRQNMEQEMDLSSFVETGTPQEQGVLIIKGGGEISPPVKIPLNHFSAPIVIEEPSTYNTFSVGPSGSFFLSTTTRIFGCDHVWSFCTILGFNFRPVYL